jgi:queuine tRNA-ribosyltransferase
VGEPSAARLLTLHNVSWLLRLVDRTRDAIRGGTLDRWRAEVLAIWS